MKSTAFGTPRVLRGVVADLLKVLAVDPAAEGLLQPLLFFKGFHALATYRVAHTLWCGGGAAQMGAALMLQSRASELFGVDMMLDAAGKVWLLEVNNSPGLEYCDSHETGVCPDAGWNDDVTKQICHDRFALLGMDRDVCAKGDANNFVRVC